MKKIVSIAVIATMIAGIATADVSIKMQYRTRAAMLNMTQQDITQHEYKMESLTKGGQAVPQNVITKKDGKTTDTKWFDLDGYASSQDSLAFAVNSEKAGVALTLSPQAQAAKTMPGADVKFLNTYNAYMKFGDLKIAAGTWKDGVADGAYRVKKDHDAANTEGIDAELMKLGSGFSKVYSAFVDNVGDFAGGDGDLLAYAEYSLALNDSMKLNLLAGMLSTEYETHGKTEHHGVTGYDKGTNKYIYDGIEGDKETTSFQSGAVARVQFNMKDLFNSELIYKNPNSKTQVFGLYFMPKMVKGLDLNIGGAIEMGKQGGWTVTGTLDDEETTKHALKNYEDYTNWSVDLRARYQIMDNLSVMTMNKLWGTTYEQGFAVQKGLAGMDGKKGILGGKDGGAQANIKMGLWDMVGVRYVINDTFACFLNGAIETALDGDTKAYATGAQVYDKTGKALIDKDGKFTGKTKDIAKVVKTGDTTTKTEVSALEWHVTPGFQIYASKTASITIMCAISGGTGVMKKEQSVTVKQGKNTYQLTSTEKTQEIATLAVAIPVVFRVKL